jgi:hypothetical protein
VPCEHLFSASKQTADLHRLSLSAKHFEELQVMKFAWGKKILDNAEQNWARVEKVQLGEYSEFLDADERLAEWDQQLDNVDEFILYDSDNYIYPVHSYVHGYNVENNRGWRTENRQ